MMDDNIRIAITGGQGRMGRSLILAAQQKHMNLGGVLVKPGSSVIGRDVGELIGSYKFNIKISDNLYSIIDDFDLLIDFTNTQATMKYLDICLKYKKPMVIGTTGFNQTEQDLINRVSQEIAIVLSANFSIGMNIVLKLLEKTAKVIGSNSDIEIIEKHHSRKIDAPSGTALVMGKTIANVMNLDFDKHKVCKREGIIGERKKQSIGLSTVRAGDIIGEHTAIFASIGEIIEINHKVSSRMNFAIGAIKAAEWLKYKKYGLFDMCDVLNLSCL
ncbi:4-hydroxy-tetrahydrodipicolinate reductase [Candidatus Pantoea edessiphila]|uniref:4-hydroxy-tetrahydrodipicolinate reductase n=1 Tax=Candidatus Pantoea edessiphila TaxID=2044610 RepID=A0A2P5T274_9GAMM|nr:4-hydroxy-tetrahydrodipicolinate reductase [Candidatus Pantoea edessiphila]PPI88689.1 4-hydroxy-tetrahydrodipicolinate reductase [Candidatus Pantoea edessiphila]